MGPIACCFDTDASPKRALDAFAVRLRRPCKTREGRVPANRTRRRPLPPWRHLTGWRRPGQAVPRNTPGATCTMGGGRSLAWRPQWSRWSGVSVPKEPACFRGRSADRVGRHRVRCNVPRLCRPTQARYRLPLACLWGFCYPRDRLGGGVRTEEWELVGAAG